MHGVMALAQLFVITSVCRAAFGSCITSGPQTAIGYAGQRLTYSCEASCGEKFWRLNGSFAEWKTDYPYRAVITVSTDGRISTLSVEASAATNNSVVTCWLSNPPNNEESNAEIIVQGTVAEPTIILFNYDDNHVNLSWNQPYTLPETELEFAINVSMGSNYRLFTTAETRISFSYSFLNIDHCISDHTVNITVYGMNGAGEGEPSFVQAMIPQSQSKNCSQAINRLGPPTDVNTVVEETSLILSWQPPLLLNSPDVIVCYKISLNVSTSLHSLSTLTQFMPNCTVDTTYNFSFSAIGINQCNEDYLVEVHIAGVDMTQVEGDFARITKMIPSTQICSPTVNEDRITTVTIGHTPSASNVLITIAATTPAVITLTLGASVALIIVLFLILKKQRSKTIIPYPNLKENGAYGVSLSMRNDAYHCNSEEEQHIYEEIVATQQGS